MKKNIVYIVIILAGVALGLQPLFAGIPTTNGASLAGAFLVGIGSYLLYCNNTQKTSP